MTLPCAWAGHSSMLCTFSCHLGTSLGGVRCGEKETETEEMDLPSLFEKKELSFHPGG